MKIIEAIQACHCLAALFLFILVNYLDLGKIRKKGEGMRKTQRVQALTELLIRWGKMDKNSIDQQLANKLDLELTSALKRAIYRDLNDLVNSNIAIVEYYSRDGVQIEEFDSDINKNVVSKWHITGAENKIVGESLLERINSRFHCPTFLKNDMILSLGNSDKCSNFRRLYFSLLGQFMCLKVNLGAVPINILISRNNGEIRSDEIKAVENMYTKRCVILKVPSNMVSSFDPNLKKNGHLLITINEGSIVLKDLDSTNGSKLHILSQDVAYELLDKGDFLGNETMSTNWSGIVHGKIQLGEVFTVEEADPPFLLDLAEELFILVI